MDIDFRENGYSGGIWQPSKNTTFFIMVQKKKATGKKKISNGIAIILGLALIRAWMRAAKPTPIISPPNSKYTGRMIGVTLSFPNMPNRSTDTYYQKAKCDIKLLLCLIYHPVKCADEKEINEDLDSFYTEIPWNAELLYGQFINLNMGTENKDVLRCCCAPWHRYQKL